jgi:hypothetical protein
MILNPRRNENGCWYRSNEELYSTFKDSDIDSIIKTSWLR